VTLAAKFPPNEYICDGKILKLISHGILNPIPTSDIWYFEPYGILTPGPNFIHGKLNPHGILNSLISNQDIGKGFDLP
jgi:hypothetical protein